MNLNEFTKITYKIVGIFLSLILINSSALAEIVFKPSLGIGAGEYLNDKFTEIRLGGSLHLVEAPLAFELHGFQRVIHEKEDFYGLDLEMKLKRQFKISDQYMIGTYIGPGYRFATNDLDAPLLDFSLVVSKSNAFSLHLGYKIILLDWGSQDYKNDSLAYFGLQL